MRQQYHFHRRADGLAAWDVHRLVKLAAQLPVQSVDPDQFAELERNYWFEGADPATPRAVIEHIRLIDACDLSYPIILASDGRVMDGMHRICKAILLRQPHVNAVQFAHDPEPDYTNCNPEDLPYD